MSNDLELLNRYVVMEDREALGELFGRHYPAVFGVVRRLVADGVDAETGHPLESGTFQLGAVGAVDTLGPVLKGKIEIRNRNVGRHAIDVAFPLHVPRSVEFDLKADTGSADNEMTLRFEKATCVRVTRVPPDSRAADAGLQVNDLVLKYGDADIRNLDDLDAAASAADTARTVTIQLYRKGSLQTLQTLGGDLGMRAENDRSPMLPR